MKKWQANLGLLLVAMIWGGSFLATDNLLNYFDPLNLQVIRNFIGCILLIIIFFKKFIRVSKKTVLIGFLFGLLFLLANTVQSIGLQYTTVSKNAFLTANYVLFIPLVSLIFFKEIPTKYILVGLCFMLLGYFLIIFEINVFSISSYQNLKEEMHFNIGDFLTVVSALLFALHIIAVNHLIKDQDPIQVLIFQLLAASLLGAIYMLIFNVDFQLSKFSAISEFGFSLFYMVVLSSIICFGGQLIFQKYTDSASAGILMSLESAFAAMFAVLFNYDDFYSGLLFGGALVIIGIITAETNLSFLKKKKSKEKILK
ncbi:MAG: DMT family transporter [Bacilli bacterium]